MAREAFRAVNVKDLPRVGGLVGAGRRVVFALAAYRWSMIEALANDLLDAAAAAATGTS